MRGVGVLEIGEPYPGAEFSALIAIFGSVGPVISTRRSTRSGGCRGDRPVAVADVLGLVEEVEAPGPCHLVPALTAALKQLVAA